MSSLHESFHSLPKSFPLTKTLYVIWPQVGSLALLPSSLHFAHFTPATPFFKHTEHHPTQGLDSFSSHLEHSTDCLMAHSLFHVNLCSDVICPREAFPDSSIVIATLLTTSSSLSSLSQLNCCHRTCIYN